MEAPVLHGFAALDWGIVAAVLVLTTLVGAWLGKHSSLRDFFLGGRSLPWWAVSASIVATEISAVTLVSVPWVVYQPGGSFTFLQVLAIGSILARLAIAWKLVPLYFEREVYSPYDVLGERLGAHARTVASALFTVGGVLSQAARVYLTALVLQVVLHEELAGLGERFDLPPLAISVGIISLFAIAWTWFGGIATVVWTDLILLCVFVASGIALLVVLSGGLDLGFERIWRVGVDSHRFRFLDFDTSPGLAYTFWAAALGSAFGNVGAYGVDQLVAQRLLCCADARAARKAILVSSLAVCVTILFALVGVGLFAWYERHPMSAAGAELVAAAGDRIVAVFVMESVPAGLRGLVVAGILAAAISSLDSMLGALSQTAVSGAWIPWRRWRIRRRRGAIDLVAEDRSALRASRAFVVVFGLLLGGIAMSLQPVAERYGSVLDLALSMPGYTQGALLAGILLALTRAPVDGSGYLWSAPLSALWVFAAAWHGEDAQRIVLVTAAAVLAAWIALRAVPEVARGVGLGRVAVQTGGLAAGLALAAWVSRHGDVWRPGASGEPGAWMSLAFPWYVPAGCAFAFVFGHLLARQGGDPLATGTDPARP